MSRRLKSSSIKHAAPSVAVLHQAAPAPRSGRGPSVKPFDPVAFTPTIKTRQPDGSITVRAGVPVILNGADEIGTAEAARILGCEIDWIGKLCDRGTFIEGEDWRRIGTRGNYKLKRAAVIKHAGLKLEEQE